MVVITMAIFQKNKKVKMQQKAEIQIHKLEKARTMLLQCRIQLHAEWQLQ